MTASRDKTRRPVRARAAHAAFLLSLASALAQGQAARADDFVANSSTIAAFAGHDGGTGATLFDLKTNTSRPDNFFGPLFSAASVGVRTSNVVVDVAAGVHAPGSSSLMGTNILASLDGRQLDTSGTRLVPVTGASDTAAVVSATATDSLFIALGDPDDHRHVQFHKVLKLSDFENTQPVDFADHPSATDEYSISESVFTQVFSEGVNGQGSTFATYDLRGGTGQPFIIDRRLTTDIDFILDMNLNEAKTFSIQMRTSASNMRFDLDGSTIENLTNFFSYDLRFGSNSFLTDATTGEILSGYQVTSASKADFKGHDVGSLGIAAALAHMDGAVPEPSTWALMICGFGAVGSALRRRRRAASFA